MSADRDTALKALDDAFADGVKRLFSVFLQGLEDPSATQAELMGRFKRGLAYHCDAYGKTKAIVETYFGASRP